jgi:hypothetical protein
MSCGLLVDYSSSSDDEEDTVAEKKGGNGERRSHLSRPVDPSRTGPSRGSHAQLSSRDGTTDRKVGAACTLYLVASQPFVIILSS